MVDEKVNEPEELDNEVEADLDLDEQDAVLSAKIGKPYRIRMSGKVITVPHMDSWEYIHSRMMAQGDFTGWARGVLSTEDFDTWAAASLRNYQIQEIMLRITLHAGIGLGKSNSSSRSSRPKRKR
jgi:hypothetical protein